MAAHAVTFLLPDFLHKMPSRLLFAALIFALLLFIPEFPSMAGLWKSPGIGRDSLASRTERGVELTRQSEYLHWSRNVAARMDFRLTASWKSEWIQPGGETERRRQDGRWNLLVGRQWKPWVKLWGATQGEYFDERPSRPSVDVAPPFRRVPGDWQMDEPATFVRSVSPVTVRILRGGGGVQTRPFTNLELIGSAGAIEDRRFGHVTSGPLWGVTGNLTDWELSGYKQDFTFEAEGENPGCHRNRDLRTSYKVFREFSPGTVGRADVSASEVRRSYYLDASNRLATRKERRARFSNSLTYAILENLDFELDGELFDTKTEIAQDNRESSLEESSAGFETRLVRRVRRFSGKLGLAVRSVTQTIDGDILQGRQTNLDVGAGFRASRRDSIFGRFDISKYQLDTRSTQNNDDRDELRLGFLVGGRRTLNPYLGWEAWARVTLDHLVYLFKERSANNRWTRLFFIGSKLRHRPSKTFTQTFTFEVSANYQAYDYENDPPQVRSTVFRRLSGGDSLAIEWTRTLSTVARIRWQREELGRLFWHEFQEERSDEVTAIYSRLEFPWRIGRRTVVALGGVWNHRRGVRFPTTDIEEKEVFQDLQTYGPVWSFQHGLGAPLTVDAGGQVVRQLELGREDRWLVMGEIGVSIKW